jgi:flagellar hook assembly protein FlgD
LKNNQNCKDTKFTSGNYTASWKGTNSMGKAMPSGLYFYSMEADGFTATNKMLLLK